MNEHKKHRLFFTKWPMKASTVTSMIIKLSFLSLRQSTEPCKGVPDWKSRTSTWLVSPAEGSLTLGFEGPRLEEIEAQAVG